MPGGTADQSTSVFGKVGPLAQVSDGSINQIRMTKMGAQAVGDSQARYYEQTSRGKVYHAANVSATTMTAGLSATSVGVTLSNPVGSTKWLVVLAACWVQSTGVAAVNFLCGTLYSATEVTHTTPLTVRAGLWTGAVSAAVGKADSTCTLPAAPLVIMPLMSSAGVSALSPATGLWEAAGLVICTPGTAVCIQGSTGSVGWGSIVWEEVDIPA